MKALLTLLITVSMLDLYGLDRRFHFFAFVSGECIASQYEAFDHGPDGSGTSRVAHIGSDQLIIEKRKQQ